MQRWSALVLLGVLVTSVVLLVLGVGPKASSAPLGASSSASSSGPAASGSASGGPVLLLGDGAPAASSLEAPAPLEEPDLKVGGALLPTGEPAPTLPEGTPKTVNFGVVLVEYRGAQGATRKARTREEAETLAKEIAGIADKDFAAAVAKGDPGSSADAGVMPRGVLEPGPEHVLFTLAVGAVGGPVDTPRGFWVVKRLE